MRLSVFRRNDLIRGLWFPFLAAVSVLVGWLAPRADSHLPGVAAGALTFVVLGLPFWAWRRFGWRCPRCLTNLATNGWARGAFGGWVRTGDILRGTYAGAAQYCAVCELDLTRTAYGDWPEPASAEDRRAWVRKYREASRARRDRPFFGSS